MDGLRGLGSFAVVATGVLLALRLVHVGVPLFVADARPGPFVFADLDEVESRVGFRPVLPAYRPAVLGERPATMTGWLIPRPAFEIVWQGERFLSVTQLRGGGMPDHPPVSRVLGRVPDSRWWLQGDRSHLVMRHGDFWIVVETDLPHRDLTRIADTLTPF